MRHGCVSSLPQQNSSLSLRFLHLAAVAALTLVAASAFAIQDKTDDQQTTTSPTKENPLLQEFSKYPGLTEALGHLQIRLSQELKMPAARAQSNLLPVLPETTVFYAAFPNYGDVVNQALKIFQQERKDNPVLADWWLHGSVAAAGPQVEDALDKVHQLSLYLGDEIVVSASGNIPVTDIVVLAQIKKPGLKAFLLKLDKEISGKAKPSLPIYDSVTLATAKSKTSGPKDDPVVLVRPDFVVVAFNLPTLRKIDKLLNLRGARFASTPFGTRLNQAYAGGAELLAGADLHTIIRQNVPPTKQTQAMLQSTGFGDAKYLIWEQKNVPGHPSNRGELSFSGPRHGVASWLASPEHLGGLDFVSAKSPLVLAIRLKNPAQIFDDLKDLDSAAGSNSMAGLGQMEEAFKINLRDALLARLTGELVLEVGGLTMQDPSWKVILRTSDPQGLQQTLDLLATAAHFPIKSHQEDGATYHSFSVPNGPKTMYIEYAIVDGYLLVAPSHSLLTEAMQLHRSGDGLGKSKELRAAMPAGSPLEASALFYQNLGPLIAPMMRQFAPEMARLLPQTIESKPSVSALYGEESAIRQASNDNGGFSVGAIGVIAAVAIPNLMRSRIAANEAAAAATVRTVNTAQVTYSVTYANRGFAPDLATLGPGPSGDCQGESASAACLLNGTLAPATCASGTWCAKNGYRYSVSATCTRTLCEGYVVVATPVDPNTGGKSFCSTEDGMVRTQSGPPLESPVTSEECQTWAPVQ